VSVNGGAAVRRPHRPRRTEWVGGATCFYDVHLCPLLCCSCR
jgi:hypothetical protein